MSKYPKLIRQKNSTTCGQSVLAMLLSIPLEDAIKLVGHDGITTDDEIWANSGTESQFVDGCPPKGIVAIQKHKEPKGTREHWTLWYRDKTLDPANLGNRIWPVYKYFEIDWEK